jgi:hypothetical protein
MPSPKFTGVWIPAEVLALELSFTAKILYGIVDSLDNDGCFASNGYLAETLGLSDRSIRSALAELETAKLIYRIDKDGQRLIRTVEKVALVKALGEEVNFHRGRKKTSTGGGRKLPTYNKEDNKVDSIKEEPAPLSSIPFSSIEFINAWNAWIDYRKEIKKPMRMSSINGQFVILKNWGEQKSITAIKNSIANGWVGLFEPKQSYTQSKQPLTAKDHNEF